MNQVTGVKKRPGIADIPSVNKADTLVLSDHAQGLQFAKEQVLKSPEIRAERVSELKNKFWMALIRFLHPT